MFVYRPNWRVSLGFRDVHGYLCWNMVQLTFSLSLVCESVDAEFIVNRTMCQKNLRDERQRVQMVIEAMPRKLAAAKEAQEAEAKAGGSVGSQQVSGKEACH